MSFDLVVFDPNLAPSDHQKFMDWFKTRTLWKEGHSYDDPKITSHNLQNWFYEIIKSFPPLNGPYSKPLEDYDSEYYNNPKIADYSIGKDMIYVGFGWSIAETAYIETKNLAYKHNIGFFNASDDDAEIIIPNKQLDLYK